MSISINLNEKLIIIQTFIEVSNLIILYSNWRKIINFLQDMIKTQTDKFESLLKSCFSKSRTQRINFSLQKKMVY